MLDDAARAGRERPHQRLRIDVAVDGHPGAGADGVAERGLECARLVTGQVDELTLEAVAAELRERVVEPVERRAVAGDRDDPVAVHLELEAGCAVALSLIHI